MRTAVTLARPHGKKSDVLVFGREVPIYEQSQSLRALLGKDAHPDYEEVFYQESDGLIRKLTFEKPASKPAPVKP